MDYGYSCINVHYVHGCIIFPEMYTIQYRTWKKNPGGLKKGNTWCKGNRHPTFFWWKYLNAWARCSYMHVGIYHSWLYRHFVRLLCVSMMTAIKGFFYAKMRSCLGVIFNFWWFHCDNPCACNGMTTHWSHRISYSAGSTLTDNFHIYGVSQFYSFPSPRRFIYPATLFLSSSYMRWWCYVNSKKTFITANVHSTKRKTGRSSFEKHRILEMCVGSR